ncbi:GntR family transcriptional regulator [Nonomuraea sp. NPDC050022]|uniref:GntR family transcriptional regulator n=1 Tax=unclassified Nonomuraea TaxID=2593643 RepID=UPI0033D13FFA
MAQPLYQRIVNDYREAIESGRLRPGELLPSEPELIARYHASKSTVGKAIAALKAEGLVFSQRGRGVFARRRPSVRRIASERYRADMEPQDTPQTSFTAEQGIAWQDYRLDRAYEWIEADERLGELFGVAVGTRVLERRFVFHAKGEPTQMSRPCLLASDVEGTPVADPDREPWPGGTIAQLRSIGIVVDDVQESVSARMPTPEETTTLSIGSGVPVFAITRRMLAQGRVVEVADPIVIPADRAILDYQIKLG